jgi:hypothetical protein
MMLPLDFGLPIFCHIEACLSHTSPCYQIIEANPNPEMLFSQLSSKYCANNQPEWTLTPWEAAGMGIADRNLERWDIFVPRPILGNRSAFLIPAQMPWAQGPRSCLGCAGEAFGHATAQEVRKDGALWSRCRRTGRTANKRKESRSAGAKRAGRDARIIDTARVIRAFSS